VTIIGADNFSSMYDGAELIELDGARVCVVALGAGHAGQTLLLHGNPSHLAHFESIVPALSRHGGVIAYDHPGFGRSSAFADGVMTLERSARLGVTVLNALGVDRPVDVIGHSHGGLVAIAMAALAPERVRSIAVMGTGASPAPVGYRVLRAVPGLATLLPHGRALAGIGVRASFVPDAVPEGFVARQVGELRARPEILGAMVRLALDDPGAKASAYAGRVQAPALVVHAKGDALVGARHARRLATTLPSARFVAVDGGHMVHIAHPERVVPLLDEWLVGR
jgi:3-oxoadipate enol-lactonase